MRSPARSFSVFVLPSNCTGVHLAAVGVDARTPNSLFSHPVTFAWRNAKRTGCARRAAGFYFRLPIVAEIDLAGLGDRGVAGHRDGFRHVADRQDHADERRLAGGQRDALLFKFETGQLHDTGVAAEGEEGR